MRREDLLGYHNYNNNCQFVLELGRQHLRSSDVTCAMPRTQSQIGDRSFTAAGPPLCN